MKRGNLLVAVALLLTLVASCTQAAAFGQNCSKPTVNCTEANNICVNDTCACSTGFYHNGSNCVESVPTVTIQNTAYEDYVGSSITIPCSYTGDPTPTVVWSVHLDNGTTFTIPPLQGRYTLSNEAGKKDLTITKLLFSDRGNYTCQANNSAGQRTDVARLNVKGAVPTVTIQNTAYEDYVGSSITIPCSYTGDPTPTVVWSVQLLNGTLFTIDSSGGRYTLSTVEGSKDLTITKLLFSDKGNYTCQANNSAGQQTDVARLSVKGAVPTVTIQNTAYEDYVGSSITIPCSYTGDPTPTVVWSVQLLNGTLFTIDSSGGRYTLSTVEGSKDLTITKLLFSDKGNYTCQANNSAGQQTDVARLSVKGAVPTVTIQNTAYEDYVGSSITIPCSYTGDPTPTVVWSVQLLNGTVFTIDSSGGRYTLSTVEGSKDLTITKLLFSDKGNYTCQANNSAGQQTDVARLSVKGDAIRKRSVGSVTSTNGTVPTVTIQNTAYEDYVGSSITIPCSYTGDPTPTVVWSVQLLNGTVFTIDSSGGRYTLSTVEGSKDLTITKLLFSDKGNYTCQANNSAGQQTDVARLSVKGDAIRKRSVGSVTSTNGTVPTVVIAKDSYSQVYSLDITIPCQITAAPDVTSSRWTFTKTSQETPITSSGRYTIAGDKNNPDLTITGVVFTDAGTYKCIGENAAGSNSDSAVFSVTGGIVNVTIGTPSLTKIGTDVTISCNWTGTPVATEITWKKDNNLLNTNNATKYSGGNVSVPSLTIKNVEHSDNGSFQCLAKNAVGPGSSRIVTLSVIDRQFGDDCSDTLICDDSKDLACTGGKCQCKSTHYNDSMECHPKKKLNETCNMIMKCVDDDKISCIGGFCSCNTGYYDDNGSATGGTCQPRPDLGYSCNTTVLCQEGTRCATDEICRCPAGQYDDNKEAMNGACRNLTELKVTSFNLSATTNSISVTWVPPSKSSFISRYDVIWRVAGTSGSFTNQSAGLSTSTTISTGLVPGQAYDVVIDSVDTYTQVAEQSVPSDTKQVRLKPEPPGRITNPNNLDAPNILLNWTAPQNNTVTRYSVQVDGGSPQNTTDSTPSLTLTTTLVPGQYYNITIITISGSAGAPGGKTQSVPYIERIRTMVEKPGSPTNVQCPTSPKDRSLEISWTAPTNPNGFIQHYIINVSFANGSLVKNIEMTGKNTSFNVKGLDPEQSYMFEVFTVNDGSDTIKTSNGSQKKECKTMAALATPPLNLITSGVQSRRFTISFGRPSDRNGVLTGYVIYVYTDSQEECVQEILVTCSDCGNGYKRPSYNSTCSGNKTDLNHTVSDVENIPSITYDITNLLPYTNYTVKVAGINGVGEGNLATSQPRTTLQEVPQMPDTLQVGDILSTSVNISWSIADPRPGPTTITLYLYEIVNRQHNLVKMEKRTNAFSLRHYNLTGLEEYWDYYFEVNAGTIIGNMTSNQSSVFRTKASAPGPVSAFTVKRDNFTKAVVSWRIPPLRDRNSYLEKYVLIQNFTDLTDEDIDVLQNDELVTKTFVVTPETLYSIEVYAVSNESSNNEGERRVKIYYALPGPPPAPGDKIPNVITTTTGGESSTQTSFVVEIDIDFFGDTTNGAIEFFGIAPCKMGNCEVSFLKGGQTDNWRTLPNYQEAKNKGYTLYRATDERYMQRVQSTLSRSRRRRATTQHFTVGNEDCSGHNASTYCNGPLPADTSFMVVIFVCTRGGCTSTDPYGPFKTKQEERPIWIYIVAAVAAVVLVAIIIGVFIVVRRKRRQATTKKNGSSIIDDIEDPEEAELKRIPRKRPIKLSEIDEVVGEKHRDSNLRFAKEYEDLKRLSPKHDAETSEYDANKLKNRYVNILPFDHSRVKLLPLDDEPATDFINANYLPGYKLQREYIAAQGPLPGTIDDFWRMIWEQNVGIVIMLTLCKEDGRVKCEPYWSIELREAQQYGEITVETVSTSTVNSYDFRIFKLKLGTTTRTLKHFHFLQWKDFSANVQNDTMIDFIKNVRSHIQPPDVKGPVVVHCSAGVGRTGTFVALDHLIQFIDDNDLDAEIDIFDLVLNLRENRMFMVQTEQQYIFIHDVVRDYVERKRRDMQGENLYQNVNLGFEPDDSENLYANVAKTEL